MIGQGLVELSYLPLGGIALADKFLLHSAARGAKLMGILAASEAEKNFVDVPAGSTAWIGLGVVIVALLAIDLYRHRKAHVPTFSESAKESLFWVACGLTFAGFVWVAYGSEAFGEYIAGYLVEKSLSVDNVFVWSMLFSSMSIPVKYQHRVLFWGIFGALALRAIFIFGATELLQQFNWLFVIFGGFLVFTGIRMIRHTEDESEKSATTGLGLLSRIMPVSDALDGQKFFTMQNGKRAATPLLAALVVVEATDVVFALDSVPAILAIAQDPFLVLSSNAFAILGLRAMYFLLADARDRFHYLNHALGFILIFVGLKMAALWLDWHLPWSPWSSLIVIGILLLLAIVFSELRVRKEAASLTQTTPMDASVE